MSISDEARVANWWASGDTPVRRDSRVTYFVDGRMVMLMMCRHFLRARRYIYLANWGVTPGIELVRGSDHRAGPDGSPEQQALLAGLRAEGLSEAEIEFWCTHALSLKAVLGYALSKGVEVRVLLWDCYKYVFSHYDAQAAHKELTEIGVTCLLDDSARGILHHPIESLHQKITIVDGTHAFVGGVDPMIEPRSEFDRWDTHSHPYSTPLRRHSVAPPGNTSPHPWHDAHALIEGPAAADVELNFRQHWNDVVQRHRLNADLLVPDHPAPPPDRESASLRLGRGEGGGVGQGGPLRSPSLVQVARTIPEHTYSFEPLIIQGIAELYKNALSNIQHFVYLENQYLWLRAYSGVDIPLLGSDSPDMETNLRKLGEALRRGATVIILLPDHPAPGRAFSDAGLQHLRSLAPEAVAQGRLQAFCLGASGTKEDGEHYRPIYVHAKVAIIDDIWTTVGSANLNNRGMRDDTEMNVATLDAELAFGLRVRLWAEHLGLLSDEDLIAVTRYLSVGAQFIAPNVGADLSPPTADLSAMRPAEEVWHYLQETLGDREHGLKLMVERAWENLERYKARQPFVGHLLPYLVEEEAEAHGLNFREAHGWLEEEDH